MKRLFWLMIASVPLLGWAQSGGNMMSGQGIRPVPATNTLVAPKPAGSGEVSLSQLYDRLQLTALQQGLWRVFEDKVDAYTGTYYRQKPVQPSLEDAAPHQIGRMVDNLQNRLAALEDVETAAKALYANLTPDQQQIANQMMALAIPTFTAGGASPSSVEDRRKDAKSEAGKRSRRGGLGTGSGGAMPGN